jgi:hypothetical protein
MKKSVLTALSCLCLLAISSQAYSMPMNDNMKKDNMSNDKMMSGNSSQMMSTKMTENDLYSHLNDQDKAMYDKFNAEQKAFVVRVVNSEMQMMHQKKMSGQTQMQDRGMMNRGNMQQN